MALANSNSLNTFLLKHDLSFASHFLFVCFEKYVNQFRLFSYLFFSDQNVWIHESIIYIDPVHSLMK